MHEAEFSTLKNQASSSQAQAVTISLVVIATICAAAAAVAVKAVLVPTLLATLLALALTPVVSLLERTRLPSALAAAMTVLTVSGVIVAVSVVAAPRFDGFMAEIPTLLERISDNARSFERSLRDVGDATKAIGTMVSDHSGQSGAQTVKIAGDSPARFLLKSIPVVVAQFFYVVLLATFILAERRKYRLKLITAAQSLQTRLRLARILRDMGKKVSGYLFAISVINVFDGIAAAAAFYLLGLPDPILWGVAFAVGNFVPVIGAAVIIVASATAGLALHDDLLTALVGPATLTAINVIEGNIIQPLLLSRRMVVNPIALLVFFALFAWMWGAAATLLAAPIVVCLAVIARHTPGMQLLAVLLTNEQPIRGGLVALLAAARVRRPGGNDPATTRVTSMSGAAARLAVSMALNQQMKNGATHDELGSR